MQVTNLVVDETGSDQDKKQDNRKGKWHNVYTIEVYQTKKLVQTVVRRKSDFKELTELLEKNSTKRGGR